MMGGEMHKPENERIHHNGEDYVPTFWMQGNLDAMDRCCGELETAEKRIAALEAAGWRVVSSLVRAYPVAPDGICEVCHRPVREGHRDGCALKELADLLAGAR
jgi:hypothetical protein